MQPQGDRSERELEPLEDAPVHQDLDGALRKEAAAVMRMSPRIRDQGADEQRVHDRREEREHELEHDDVRDREPLQAVRAALQVDIAVLERDLDHAEHPAEALLVELPHLLRRLGHGKCARLVAHEPAGARNLEGNVGVFRCGVAVIEADVHQRAAAPGADSAGHDGNAVDDLEGAPVHALRRQVLERLEA